MYVNQINRWPACFGWDHFLVNIYKILQLIVITLKKLHCIAAFYREHKYIYTYVYAYLYTLRFCTSFDRPNIQYTVYVYASSVSRRISCRFYPYMWSVDETHVVLCTGFILQILSGQHCLNCLLLVPLKWSINFTFRGCLTSRVSLTRVHFLRIASSCVQMEPHSKHVYVPG